MLLYEIIGTFLTSGGQCYGILSHHLCR